MLIVTIKPLRLMNIVKTRSKAVTHNRFVRCLMSHFDFLQDETSNMNQATTILFMLANLYIQVVPTNNVVDSCLSLILGSQRWVPLIFVVCITVTVVLICLMLASLFFEQIYLANSSSSTLGKPKHLTSPWYRLYKHLYRFHFLVSEPILSGYAISFVYPHDPIEASFLPYHYCGVVSGLIGLLLSLPYLFFVESILPNSSITSASNRVNIGLTAMSLRLCLFVDAYYVGTTSLTTIFVLMMGRLLPSIIATYVNLFDTHFFNKYSRLVMVGFQVSNIVYSLIFYIMGNNSVTPTLVPACLFIAIGWRLVHNMDTRERTNLRNLSVNKLDDVLSFWSQLMDQANSITGTASMNALRFQAVMAHLTRSNQGQFEEYTDNFATTEEKSQDQACNPNFFMVYLFERNWRNSGEKDFKTLAYETLWAVYVRSNIFHLSVMLARLNTLDLNIVEKSTYRAVLRRVEEYTTEVYQEKMSLVPSKEQFYAPKTITEMNETAATKARFTAVDDDSKDGIDQTRTILPTLTRKSEMIHFDIYSSMITIEKYEKLVENMQEVISTILKFYEKLKNRVVEIASAHDTMKLVKRLKESVNKNFHYLDKMSGEQNLFHLLPYALFLEIINNDRQASQKVLKAYEFRSQQLERSLQMARSLTISNKFSLDLMLCIGVDCTRSSLGRMNYVSSNCVEVFRVPKKHFDSRNISCLMTDDFQPIHNDFMDKFVRDQDKPYLGISHERHVRIREHIYARCDVLVKLSPVLHSSMLSFMCLLKKHVSDEEFIVLNHQGVIVGRSQALEWAEPFCEKDFGTISASLPSEAVGLVRKFFLKNKLDLALASTGEELDHWSQQDPRGNKTRYLTHSYSSNTMQITPDKKTQNFTWDKTLLEGINNSQIDVEPAHFMYQGRKIFVSLVVNFKRNAEDVAYYRRLGLLEGQRASKTGQMGLSNSQSIGQQSMERVTLLKPAPLASQSRIEFRKMKDGTQEDNLPAFWDTQDQELNLTKKMTSGSLVKFNSASFKRLASSTGKQLSVNNRRKKKEQDNQANEQSAKKLDDQVKGRPNLLDNIEGYNSSRKSSNSPSTTSSTRFKARVMATMRHQRKYMTWKELFAVVFLQVLIWSICAYAYSLMDDSFARELRALIDLRSGTAYMIQVTASGYNAGIGILERMLELRNLIPTNKYTAILPSIHRNLDSEITQSISQLQDRVELLIKHIYGFDFEYGKRYLETTYQYKYYLGSDDAVATGSKLTKVIDLIDHGREWVFLLHRMKGILDEKGLGLTFDNLLVAQLYELMSDARTVVMSKTISRLLDTDNMNYQSLAHYVTKVTVGVILACLVLAQFILAIFWRLRRKTVGLYSLLECLMHFELYLMQDRYLNIQSILKENAMSFRLQPQAIRMILGNDTSYQLRKDGSSKSRAYLRTRISIFSWLGYGKWALLLYLIIICNQAIGYLTVAGLERKLQTVLVLTSNQRALMTTTNAMSAINFFTYFSVLRAGGYAGKNLPLQKEINDDIAYFKNNFNLVAQLDEFLLQVQSNQAESVNFMDLLQEKPCDHLNYVNFGVPRTECESLAEGSYSRSPIEVWRWVKLQMPSILKTIQTFNATNNPTKFLMSGNFLTFEYGRRAFNVEFVYDFTIKFFSRLREYHHRMFVRPVRTIIFSSLIVCVVMSLMLVATFGWNVRSVVEAGLQVFLLIPPESYYHNPHIAAKLLTITR